MGRGSKCFSTSSSLSSCTVSIESALWVSPPPPGIANSTGPFAPRIRSAHSGPYPTIHQRGAPGVGKTDREIEKGRMIGRSVSGNMNTKEGNPRGGGGLKRWTRWEVTSSQ